MSANVNFNCCCELCDMHHQMNSSYWLKPIRNCHTGTDIHLAVFNLFPESSRWPMYVHPAITKKFPFIVLAIFICSIFFVSLALIPETICSKVSSVLQTILVCVFACLCYTIFGKASLYAALVVICLQSQFSPFNCFRVIMLESI